MNTRDNVSCIRNICYDVERKAPKYFVSIFLNQIKSQENAAKFTSQIY